MAKLSRRSFLALGLCAAVAPIGYSLDNDLEVTRETVRLKGLPRAFSGFNVCHLTDLHSREFDKGNASLLSLIAESRPDAIAVTGDMVDRLNPDESVFLKLCEGLSRIAPTYFVTGNHEIDGLHGLGIVGDVARRGVNCMDNRSVTLERNGQSIRIAGVGEHKFYGNAGLKAALQGVSEDDFTLLLSHHPEQMDAFTQKKVDLVLAGHTHGGQIRLPFMGAIFAPTQGMFPRYISGLYQEDRTAMYISRGLGSSTFPIRRDCPPEMAFLTLEPDLG